MLKSDATWGNFVPATRAKDHFTNIGAQHLTNQITKNL